MRRVTRATMAFLMAATVAVVALTAIGAAGASASEQASWLPPTPPGWPLVVGDSSPSPTTITSGVTQGPETLDTVAGRQQAQVLNVDLSNPNVKARVVEAGDHVIDPADETISSMGDRTGAVAGINADFFAINGSGEPSGGSVVDGQILKTPPPGFDAELSVLPDGSMTIGEEDFSGTITSGSASHPLTSINNLADAEGGGITEATPALATTAQSLTRKGTVVTATVSGSASNETLTVTDMQIGVATLPVPAAGTVELYGTIGGADWLKANVAVGDTVGIADGLSPNPDLTQMVSGGSVIIKDGAAFTDPTGRPQPVEPQTAVGLSQDGKHAIVVTFDGEQAESMAAGVSPAEVTDYLLAHGAYSAILFDSGGSTEMDARLPGDNRLTVLNTPSDGHERPVADGLFFYSNETAAGPAVTATVNHDAQMDVLAGTAEPLSAFATDAAGNPASDPVSVSVEPSKLATVQGSGAGMTLNAGSEPGRGWLTVQAGSAKSRQPVSVSATPAALSLSPAEPDLQNSGTQQFTLTGTAGGSPSGNFAGGGPLTIGAGNATWSVSPASLGTITPDGLFTAASDGEGLATITAAADGLKATATVAVGSASQVADPMTDTGNWALNRTNGAQATLSPSTTELAQPTDSGSMDVQYSIPAASGVSQVVFFPRGNITIGSNAAGQMPTAIGVWVKGAGVAGAGGTGDNKPLDKGVLSFSESWIEANGQTDTTNEAAVNYDGWRFITIPIPAGTQLPLTLGFLDFLVINPARQLSGDLYVADLQALYSPRPPSTPPYTPIPANPSWLQYVASPGDFGPGGTTIADFDDSHLMSGNQGSTGTVITNKIADDIKALPANAAPNMVQSNGDLTDTGSAADTQYGFQTLQSFGLPFHDVVGNHEISQGADPEDGNWTADYGPTHYSYTDGNANVIVTDSANGGLLASDPFQVPAEEQYNWLVSQLSANTSKDVILLTHMPPYDPHVINNSHFSDTWEAQMYEQLAATYQATHPQVHLILLFGHARGVSEQLLNPQGQADPNGIPNFVVADAGVPAYAPVDQGGFYNYALFHFLPNGDIQFAVQPVLASIQVTAPQASLAVGATEQLTATGTTPTGDDLAPLQVPIADPASHQWSSSDKSIATVDPSTGALTGIKPGTVTVSVLSGGITASATVTITG